MRRVRKVGLGAFGAGLVLMAGSALGQEAPAPSEKRPLEGPRVRENRAPHVQDEFAEGMKREGRGVQIPMRTYAEIIGKLRGEGAPGDLRLSQEQEHDLGAIEKEFREASRAYAQEQRQKQGDQRPREGDQPQRPRREAMQEMARNGPKPGDYQTRIWAILNEKQQSHVKVELDKAREEIQKRRGEEMMQRRIDERRGGKPEARPGEGRPGEGRPEAGDNRPVRERVQRLMRRLSQLPEEEREQLLKRLEAEMDRRGIPDEPPGPPPERK
jgi:hypothetical protein